MNSSHVPEEPHPDQGLQDLVEQLALERLNRFAAEGDAALDDVRKSHPEHADAVCALLESLSRFGLIEEPAPTPAENLERIGDYRLIERIGGGGMGVVWLAEQESLGRRVALKLLRPGLHAFPRSRERFRREVVAAGRLDHPGICTVYDAGEAEGTPYLAMRYLDGETLARRIERARSNEPEGGALKSRDDVLAMVALVESVARAAHHAHEQGLVHRDRKPSHVMIGRDGTRVLLDFGLARLDEPADGGLTVSGDLLGTPAYMAPEQISGRRPVDRRSDVYALGATLYEAVTLRPPFTAPTRESLLREITESEPTAASRRARSAPRDLDVVLATALDKDPDRRYQTALDLADDLRRVRLKEPIRARPLPLALRARRWTQRNPALAVLVVALVLGLAVSLGLLGWVRSSLTTVRAVGLAGASAEALLGSPMLAVLLAREAHATRPLPETASSLCTALAALHERAVWRAHAPGTAVSTRPMGLVQFTSGERIWSSSTDGKLKVWTTRGELVRTVADGGIIEASLAPDGRRCLAVLANGGVRIYDAEGHLVRPPIDREGSGETRTTWAADGSRFLTFSADGVAVVWDRDGNKMISLPKQPRAVLAGAVSADGGLVLLAVRPPVGAEVVGPFPIQIWRVADGQSSLAASPVGHTGWVHRLEIAPDGSSFLSNSHDGTARRWSLTGKELAAFRHSWGEVFACFSPDGEQVLTCSWDKTARLWTRDGRECARMPHAGAVQMGTWSADGRHILTCAAGEDARLWDERGEPVATLRGHRDRVASGSFSLDGRMVATGAWDGEIFVWDVDNPDFPVWRGHKDGVRLACLTPDGKLLTVAADGEVRLWKDGEHLVVRKGGEHVYVAVASRDGSHLLTTDSRTVRLWRVRSTELVELREFPTPELALGACIAPDASRIAVAHRGGRTRVWSVASGERLVIDAPSASGIARGCAFSPNGRSLAIGYGNGVVRLAACEGAALKWSADLACHRQEITEIEFSPVSDQFLTASTDGTVRVWSLSGERRAELAGHDAGVWEARFSPDGSRIVTASSNVARVWSARGELEFVLRGHDGPIWSACFTPDGERVLTGSWDRTARIWPARTRALEEIADRRATRGFSERERAGYSALPGR